MTPLAIFNVAEAWAAAGSDGHLPSMNSLIFPFINFLIFVFLIYRFGLPAVKRFLVSRRDEIISAVQSADESLEKAETAVQSYRERLAAADNETKILLETLRGEGEREKTKILSEAEDLAAKIKADADFVSQQETKVARQQIRVEIAHMARDAAEKAIRANLRPVDQERFVEQFLQGIENVR